MPVRTRGDRSKGTVSASVSRVWVVDLERPWSAAAVALAAGSIAGSQFDSLVEADLVLWTYHPRGRVYKEYAGDERHYRQRQSVEVL